MALETGTAISLISARCWRGLRTGEARNGTLAIDSVSVFGRDCADVLAHRGEGATMMHKYYLINRPPSIGTHPDGEIEREVWMPARQIPDRHNLGGWSALGWVAYDEPLDFEMVWRYELRPADNLELDRYYDWRDEEGK